MGRDKTQLPWQGQTLLEHVAAALQPLVDELLIVVKQPEGLPRLPGRVVTDLVEAHALGGLYTGLRLMRAPRAVVCACDAPFLSPAIIQALLARDADAQAVVPETAQGRQPLQAVYTKAALPVIEAQLRRGRWALRELLAALTVETLHPDLVRRLDPSGLSFLNLNTPEDYAAAWPDAQRCGSPFAPAPKNA
jgi:molybdopterin-guanine dinucleotide biosynthesis protein A